MFYGPTYTQNCFSFLRNSIESRRIATGPRLNSVHTEVQSRASRNVEAKPVLAVGWAVRHFSFPRHRPKRKCTAFGFESAPADPTVPTQTFFRCTCGYGRTDNSSRAYGPTYSECSAGFAKKVQCTKKKVESAVTRPRLGWCGADSNFFLVHLGLRMNRRQFLVLLPNLHAELLSVCRKSSVHRKKCLGRLCWVGAVPTQTRFRCGAR